MVLNTPEYLLVCIEVTRHDHGRNVSCLNALSNSLAASTMWASVTVCKLCGIRAQKFPRHSTKLGHVGGPRAE